MKALCINLCLMPPFFGNTNCCKSRIDLLFDTYSKEYDILLLQEVYK